MLSYPDAFHYNKKMVFQGSHATHRGAELNIMGRFVTSLSNHTSWCSFWEPIWSRGALQSSALLGPVTWLVGLVANMKRKAWRGCHKVFPLFFFFLNESAHTLTPWTLLTGGKIIFTWQGLIKICFPPTWNGKWCSGVFTRVLWKNDRVLDK